jgi:signal transduction histidine kinase
LLIVIFLVDFVVNQKLSEEVVRNSTYLSTSEAIMRNSNMLQKHMLDMQGAFRGYLLTGNEAFLRPYYVGQEAIEPILEQQRLLVEGTEQHARLDSIEVRHNRWIVYSSNVIQARMDTMPGSSQRYLELLNQQVRTEVGKKLHDETRGIFADFDADEYRLRQERRQVLEASIERTREITLFLALTSIACAIIAGILIVRSITSRITDMVRFAEDISGGSFRQLEDTQNDELKRLSDSLNEMSGTLNKNFIELSLKNRDLDQFAYVVSHDLKAPLRGISNLVNWTMEDHGQELPETVLRNIELIGGRTIRLENMINGLLEYARIGRIRKTIEEVDVAQLLDELGELLIPANFTLRVDPGMPVLLTERLRLEQIFSNLISNAVKYHHRDHGNISIHCKDLGAWYEFSVEDDGPGIKEEYHEKIFTIFQTLKERDAFESTGVGLAIVKKILEEQHAGIHVISAEGNGSKFVFTWPKRAQQEPVKDTIPAEKAKTE